MEYSNINDKDRSYSIGGGISLGAGRKTEYNKESKKNEPKTRPKGSIDGNYSLSDKRQKNFATIGEGEITVRDGNTDLSGLNRDVSIAQYETKKKTELHGSFVLDDTTVNMTIALGKAFSDPKKAWENLSETATNSWNGLEAFYGDAKEVGTGLLDVAKRTGNFVSGDGYFTDEEVEKKKEEDARKKKEDEDKRKKDEEEKEKERKKEELLAKTKGEASARTLEILEETEWDGDAKANTENLDIINQTKMAELRAAGLPAANGACVFLSTVYGAADVLGITLTPEQISKIYNEAYATKSVGVNHGIYGVDNYQGLVNAVCKVTGTDRSSVSIPAALTNCTPADSKEITKNIVNAFLNEGSAHIRYSGHSMRIDSIYIANGNIMFKVTDTVVQDKITVIDSSTMKIYFKNNNGDLTPRKDFPTITHYTTIKKNNK